MRRKMTTRYRRFPHISDFGGIKSALGEMRGIGHPRQPVLYSKSSAAPYGTRTYGEGWFVKTITDKIASHPANSLEYPYAGERIFDAPLVGFVRGDDPIFETFKDVIGPHHMTPLEIMKWQAKKNNVSPPPAEELSVVAYVMPIARQTRLQNRAETRWPAERWAQTRLSGEIFSQTLSREIVTFLMAQGVLAIAPDTTPLFNKKRYPGVGWASPWSHRHMAYAAGLGTFGMHDFLITEKGCAHRLGSFVVHRPLQPNRERAVDIHANCLHYQGKKCLVCMKRCPVGAITESYAHDKEICYRHVAKSLKYCLRHYRIFIYGCGLCATGVPCESGIPKGIMKQKEQTHEEPF